jgi:2-polyprenyl-3-methyl-5-hydroxy-6-metoxy-1,4-benzoquinol methylase
VSTERGSRIRWFLEEPDRLRRAIFGTDQEPAVGTEHLERYRSTLAEIPPADPGDRLLDVGALPALLRLLQVPDLWGYEVRGCNKLAEPETTRFPAADSFPETTVEIDPVDVETEPLPYPSESFDVVTCLEVLEHLGRDPVHLLWEANRVLKDGGILVVTTPNIVSARSVRAVLTGYHPQLWSTFPKTGGHDRHNREYTPREIRWMLQETGFSSDDVKTQQVWSGVDTEIMELLRQMDIPSDVPESDRGDDIVAVARKVRSPAERFPDELYD